MKIKLYSPGHIEAARACFPERFEVKGWLDRKWTDEEINDCKFYEMKDFIESPSLSTYPIPDVLEPTRVMPDDFHVVNEYCLLSKTNIKSFLSIGCGLGEKEMRLAKNHPNISFIAIDNAPYVESLNNVAALLGISNIYFKRVDLSKMDKGKFDIIYSFAVIYCIPDEYLAEYFELVKQYLNPYGTAFIGCSSNFSLIAKIKNGILKLLPMSATKLIMKQTGWVRDVSHVKRYIPADLKIDILYHFNHSDHLKHRLIDKFPLFRSIIGLFSKYVFPVSNSVYLFVFRKATSAPN
jgi:SAM-dependent methyltransferase